VALIGNYSVLNKSPCKWLAGNSTAHASGVGVSAHAHTRAATNRNSDWRKFSLQDRSTPSTLLRFAARPDGYGGTGWALPTKAGALSAVNSSNGVAAFSASIAEGRNLAGTFAGAATFTATGQLVVSGSGSFAGVAAFSGNVIAALAASGTFAGVASFGAATVAKGNITATFTGVANFEAIRYATGSLSGSFSPAVTLEAQGFSQYLLDQEDIETGLTLRQALRLVAAATAGKISGGGTATVTITNAVADDVNRIVATVDTDGNRTAITYDLD
jgi:hypothetical protein